MLQQLESFRLKTATQKEEFLRRLDSAPLTREPFYRIFPNYDN